MILPSMCYLQMIFPQPLLLQTKGMMDVSREYDMDL